MRGKSNAPTDGRAEEELGRDGEEWGGWVAEQYQRTPRCSTRRCWCFQIEMGD